MIFSACASESEPPKTGEILGEDENGAAVDRSPAGHDAVAGDPTLVHPEIGRPVFDEHVELLEAIPRRGTGRCARAPSACRACAAHRCAACPPPNLAMPRRRSSSSRISFMDTPRRALRRMILRAAGRKRKDGAYAGGDVLREDFVGCIRAVRLAVHLERADRNHRTVIHRKAASTVTLATFCALCRSPDPF